MVVGGPTHAYGMARTSTPVAAVQAAAKKASGLSVEPHPADGPGLREWLERLEGGGRRAAAFDTRASAPAALTGRASKGITRELRQRGFAIVTRPESFLVTKDNHFQPGEEARARQWGRRLPEVAGTA